MEGDDIRIRLNFLYPGIAANLYEFRRGVGIMAQHIATEPIHDPTKDGADLPSPEHSRCPVDESKPMRPSSSKLPSRVRL